MATYLQASAERAGNKLNICFTIMDDIKGTATSPKSQYFLLPDNKGAFTDLVTVYTLYKDIRPSTLTKSAFQNNFLNYTLDWNIHQGADALNEHYKQLGLGGPTGTDLAEFISDADEVLDAFEEALNNVSAANLAAYEAAKAKASAEAPPASEYEEDEAHSDSSGVRTSLPSLDPTQKPRGKNKRPVVDRQLTKADRDLLNTLPKEIAFGELSGINGDNMLQSPVVRLPTGAADIGMVNESTGAGVFCTTDKITGPKGHTGTAAVYIRAGARPGDIQTEVRASPPTDGRDAEANTGLKAPDNLCSDAAFIYLSQKTDAKALLRGIAEGTYKKDLGAERDNTSIAAIKADDIVIMSRKSGIRLITGTDKKASDNSNIHASVGIDLIAGNNDSDLQPMVKGNNLVKHLKQVHEVLSSMRGIFYNHLQSQIEFNAKVAMHQHYDPFLIFLGTLAFQDPLKINGGKAFPSKEAAEAACKALLMDLKTQYGTVNTLLKNVMSNLDSLQKFGSNSILSDKNRAN